MGYQGTLFKGTSLGANASSSVIEFNSPINYLSIHSIITGSPLGTLIVECSNELVDSVASIPESSWVEITPLEESITAADVIMTKIPTVCYKWLRQRWIYTSGTGQITSMFYGIKEK